MGEVATLTEAQLAELEKYAKYSAGGSSSGPSLPAMRLVNKEGDPNFGKWMVGRKRNEDGTIEPGKRAVGMIILQVRRQFSYMSNNPDVKNCWSQMYKEYPEPSMFGSTRKVHCNKCELRDKNRGRDRCKCQIVAYNIAILEDGSKVPCVAYISGSSFMPFQDYLKTSSHVLSGGRLVEVPPFAFITMLGAAGPRRNGAVVYYEGAFKRGKPTNPNDFEGYAKKCDEIASFVEEQNAKHGNEKEEKVVDNTTTQYNHVPSDYEDAKVQDVNTGFPSEAEDIDDCPFDVAPEPVFSGAGANNSVDVDEIEAMFSEAGI